MSTWLEANCGESKLCPARTQQISHGFHAVESDLAPPLEKLNLPIFVLVPV
jgi:hypothetical protein